MFKFNRDNFEHLMTGSPAIALKLLKLFIKRIHDQKRRFLILTLPNMDTRIADVFLMLAEKQITADPEEDFGRRVFYAKPEDIAHWAGISEPECRNVLDRFVAQGRVEIYKDRIEVKNINELKRLVVSRRK
jgi:CRP-like cAMP-binding protein